MAWNRIIREYFSYNKRERRGVYALLTLLTILIIFRFSMGIWLKSKDNSSQDLARFDKLTASIFPASNENKLDTGKMFFQANSDSFQIQPFDPNLMDEGFYKQIGLNTKATKSLMNYLKAGAVLKNSRDLLKIYYMDSIWVDSMESYFIFPQPQQNEQADRELNQDFAFEKNRKTPSTKIWVKLNLNTADSAELVQIPGVGPYTAKQIIKLREALGGIREYSQLTLIYRMRDETIDILLERTFIDSKDFKSININTVTSDQLGRHPYISWKQANAVVNYRFQHGYYKQLADIKKCGIIDDSTFINIQPYLFIP